MQAGKRQSSVTSYPIQYVLFDPLAISCSRRTMLDTREDIEYDVPA